MLYLKIPVSYLKEGRPMFEANKQSLLTDVARWRLPGWAFATEDLRAAEIVSDSPAEVVSESIAAPTWGSTDDLDTE